MWWLVDHANLVYILCGIAILALIAIFWNTGRIKRLVEAAIILGFAVLFFWFSTFIITDAKRIEMDLNAMAKAALDHDPEPLRSRLSNKFEYEGQKGKGVADLVASTSKAAGVTDYKIWDYHVKFVDKPDGPREATATFQLRIEASDRNFACRCKAVFVMEENRWLLRTFEVYNLIGDSEQPIKIHLR